MDKLDTKYYKDYAEKHTYNYEEIANALDVVRDFIKQNKRILYGGMSVDLALKKKGKGIYADGILPDYDFMSDNHIDDSYELADILYQKNFTNVSSIQAMHGTTRRVRVNFVVVADITYIPSNIYELMPFIETNGIRSVHPSYQRIDMHKALSNLIGNPPLEVIFNRFSKDIKRFTLLDEAYPIETDFPKEISMQKVTINIESDVLYGGFVAYAIYNSMFKELIKTAGIEAKLPIIDYDSKLAITGNKLSLQIPSWKDEDSNWENFARVCIMTDDFERYVKNASKGSSIKYYNRFLDNYRYRTVLIDDVEIMDTKGDVLPFYKYKNVKITNYQLILLYMMQRHFTTANPIFIVFYLSMINMVKTIMPILNDKNAPESPFDVTVKSHGKFNWNPVYVKLMTEAVERLRGDGEKTIFREQFGYYPANFEAHTLADAKENWPDFDIDASDLFSINGEETKAFAPLEIPMLSQIKDS